MWRNLKSQLSSAIDQQGKRLPLSEDLTGIGSQFHEYYRSVSLYKSIKQHKLICWQLMARHSHGREDLQEVLEIVSGMAEQARGRGWDRHAKVLEEFRLILSYDKKY
jgi:hypothetical protein